jgi:hypothetical protein
LNISTSTRDLPLCSQCGRVLILVKKQVSKDTFSKIVIKTYRCPNEECQAEIDKRTRARVKIQKEQAKAKKDREDKKKSTKSTKMRLNKKKILR